MTVSVMVMLEAMSVISKLRIDGEVGKAEEADAATTGE
jgi:hypothetical protein